MRWPVVVLLLLFGIGGLVTAEAAEPVAPAVSGYALPEPILFPQPVPTATVSRNDGAADRIDHLRKAAEHLEAAGMKSLADHVRGLAVSSGDNGSSHEGASATPEQQVLLRFALLETDEASLRQAGLDFPPNQPVIRVPDRNALVDGLRQNGLVRVLAEPTLVTTIGRPTQFRSGCEVPGWTIGADGTPVSSPAHCGTLIDLVPQLTDQGDLRIQVRMEYSELSREDRARCRKRNPGDPKGDCKHHPGNETRPNHCSIRPEARCRRWEKRCRREDHDPDGGSRRVDGRGQSFQPSAVMGEWLARIGLSFPCWTSTLSGSVARTAGKRRTSPWPARSGPGKWIPRARRKAVSGWWRGSVRVFASPRFLIPVA